MRFVEVPTDRPVSQIGLGTWQFGSHEWGYGPEYDDREASAIVRRSLELGVTTFDTAEIYGRGRSEQILGAALRAADADPDRIFLATKIFPILPIAPVVQQRAVASAKRLGVSAIDLYQVHQPNPVLRDDTTMRGMQALLQVGLIRHAGVSNYSLERWREADHALAQAHNRAELVDGKTPVVLSNQVQYNLVQSGADIDLVPFARDNGRLIIAYSPLAQGLLSGRFGPDERVGGVRTANLHFLPENRKAAGPILGLLREVADAHDASPAQVALAWVIRHPCVIAIPGASSVAQLESNVAATELDLRTDEIAALSAAAQQYQPVRGIPAAPRLLRAVVKAATSRISARPA